ncbi:MAG TPA: nucleotidyl transferase AbiEii/AbiGii toxin family protein [Bacteroidales bacterium]|nr:nucleotidyl transferase AbiEii/AbiGii toxin family protein [Bacteroidales bacterium]
MLSFKEIRREFEPELVGINAFRSMVKEYLQCKILAYIFQSSFKHRLIFIGGTKLRLLNNFRRFSEDLDFDIIGDYSSDDHLSLCNMLINELEKHNIKAELDQDKKISEIDVQTRYINFPGIMEKAGFKDVPNRKFFIKLDAQKHDFGPYSYQSEIRILNHFDVFAPVHCAPDSMILSTKLCSILERNKGRDYYDIVELVKTTRPDISYIANRLEHGKFKLKYTGSSSYIKLYLEAIKHVDWDDKVREIEKFLFNQDEAIKVKMFASFVTEDKIKEWLTT